MREETNEALRTMAVVSTSKKRGYNCDIFHWRSIYASVDGDGELTADDRGGRERRMSAL